MTKQEFLDGINKATEEEGEEPFWFYVDDCIPVKSEYHKNYYYDNLEFTYNGYDSDDTIYVYHSQEYEGGYYTIEDCLEKFEEIFYRCTISDIPLC